MAPLPVPKTPTDRYLHDIAVSCRIMSDRTDEDEPDQGPSTVELREPVSGVDATPTVFTSKGNQPAEPQGDTQDEPAGDQTDEPSDDVDLESMKRGELDEHAAKVGVEDPKSLPNKDAVKDAIRKATSS